MSNEVKVETDAVLLTHLLLTSKGISILLAHTMESKVPFVGYFFLLSLV